MRRAQSSPAPSLRPEILVHPGLLLLGALLIPLALNLVLPFPVDVLTLLPRLVLSGALFVAGAVVALLAIRELREFETAVEPAEPASRLVRTGPYRISRNPLYLSQLLFLLGAAFLIASGWFIITIPALAVALHLCVVKPEERHLSWRFGDDYREYRAAVRRWI